MKILITGGTGLLGSALTNHFLNQGHEITVISRKQKDSEKTKIITWDYHSDYSLLIPIIENTDVVINLAGENIFAKRWSRKQKLEIRNSRIELTSKLVKAIIEAKNKPKLFLSASALGYYGNEAIGIKTETDSCGTDFLARVCDEWEVVTRKIKNTGTKLITLRLGIVLSKEGGALKKLLPLFKAGLGGRISNGKQYMSWIHISDLVSLINWIIENNKEGIYNCTSPNPITNSDFTRSLAKVLNRLAIIPVPGKVLEIVIGEAAKNLIGGQKVIPQKAMDEGFKFEFDTIDSALKDLLSSE